MKTEPHICRVCELLDGDTSIKECFWCHICQAFICLVCKDNLYRRAQAAWKEMGIDV